MQADVEGGPAVKALARLHWPASISADSATNAPDDLGRAVRGRRRQPTGRRHAHGSVVGLEQPVKGRLRPAQARLGQHHRLGVAHRIGNQALTVKTVHRLPVERLPRACAPSSSGDARRSPSRGAPVRPHLSGRLPCPGSSRSGGGTRADCPRHRGDPGASPNSATASITPSAASLCRGGL